MDVLETGQSNKRIIKKFGVLQIAKIMGMVYFLTSAIFMIPFGLLSLVVGMSEFSPLGFGGVITFFILPILYGIVGFVFGAIGAFVYNLIAQWIGGIEVVIESPKSPF